MSLEENRAMIRRWAEVWNQGNVDAIDEFVSDITARGTHKGQLFDISSTDKQTTLTMTETFRLAEGKSDEQWVNMDALDLLQQLGAIPESGQSGEASPPSRETCTRLKKRDSS